ncbi:HIRAN domain-containing protein [Clostridium sp.]|uniref:HIRAN domain-containing protein n=1 Tax=Clostridium sp. TaxID=1506 RepID=UPI001A370EBA|nr:HIRAN domain-containing protein [Clostridium sp.]MBK5241837.1 HIRAN domain-containing protein [Clostridium sp.]
MRLGKMFEKTIKLVGTVSKVGVQLGADIVGTVAEKINDDPEVKRRISEYGAKKGQSIKAKTSEVASKSSDIVDRAVETSMNLLKDGSVRIKDSVSQVAEGVDSSIKGMKNYNSQTMQNHSNTLPLETYSISEIEGFSNYDFLIVSKFISVNNNIVFDIVVKNEGINVGSYILVNNTSGTFATKIISIDSAVNEYDILKDGTINIIKKGVPRCRELYNTVKRNEILSIIVQGIPANYRFIGRNELAKGTISTEEKYNECSNIKSEYTRYQKCENKVSAETISEKVDTTIIGLKSKHAQASIEKLKVGDIVKLLREPSNIYDKHAIAIYNVNSEMLGYITKDHEKGLAKAMDEGIEYEAIVTSKNGENTLSYRTNIQVTKVNIDKYTNNSSSGYQLQDSEYSSLPVKQEVEAMDAFKAMFNEASEFYCNVADKSGIKAILNAPSNEAYGMLLKSLTTMKGGLNSFIAKGIANKIKAKATEMGADTDITKMDKIKAMAAIVFKKVVALGKGSTSFVFDATTIVGSAVGRVKTAREVIFDGKAKGNDISSDNISNLTNHKIKLDDSPNDGSQLNRGDKVEKSCKMDNEASILISQLTENAANTINNSMIWKKQLINLLDTKRERAVYEEDYILALEANIIFYLNTWKQIKNIVERWLREESIPNEVEVHTEIRAIQEKFKVEHNGIIRYKNGQPLGIEDIKLLRKCEAFNSRSELIEQLEFDYMYSYTRGELMYNLLGGLMGNREDFTQLSLYDSVEITERLFDMLEFNVNLCLGNIKWKV